LTAVKKLKEQGVTMQDLDPAVPREMAQATEPWVNQKAQEYEDAGVPGKATFRRLIELAITNGAMPVHKYTIN
jgi:hypothetical protein